MMVDCLCPFASYCTIISKSKPPYIRILTRYMPSSRGLQLKEKTCSKYDTMNYDTVLKRCLQPMRPADVFF